MDLTTYFWHGLQWLGPSAGLSALILLWTACRRRQTPRWGWWASGLALLGTGVLAQSISIFTLSWPDGSLSGYGLLVLALATARLLCFRKPTL